MRAIVITALVFVALLFVGLTQVRTLPREAGAGKNRVGFNAAKPSP